MPSEVQGVNFDRDRWTLPRATAWLKRHGLKPLAHEAGFSLLQFKLSDPKMYLKLSPRKIGEGVSFVMGYRTERLIRKQTIPYVSPRVRIAENIAMLEGRPLSARIRGELDLAMLGRDLPEYIAPQPPRREYTSEIDVVGPGGLEEGRRQLEEGQIEGQEELPMLDKVVEAQDAAADAANAALRKVEKREADERALTAVEWKVMPEEAIKRVARELGRSYPRGIATAEKWSKYSGKAKETSIKQTIDAKEIEAHKHASGENARYYLNDYALYVYAKAGMDPPSKAALEAVPNVAARYDALNRRR